MGESNKHKVLVEYALRFIKDSVGEELSYFIETDINDGRPLPQLTMEGYRPDVFFEYNGVMFIGEAKTSDVHNIIIKDSIDEWVDLLLKAKQNAAALSQGDISLGDYQGVADYSFGDIVKSILGFEEVDE